MNRRKFSALVFILVVGLSLIGSVQGAPNRDLVDEDLTKTVLYKGGYIPDLEVNGDMLVVTTFNRLQIFDLSESPAVQINETRPKSRVVALDPSGQWLGFNTGDGGKGDGIFVLPIEALSSEPTSGYTLRNDFQHVNDMVIDANLMVYVATDEGTVGFIQNGEILATVDTHRGGSNSLSLSTQGRLASGGEDGILKLWEGQTAENVMSFGQPIRQIQWSPVEDDTLAVQLADGTVKLWQAGITQDFAASATTLAWSSDGTRLALGQESGTIEVWDVAIMSKATELTRHSMRVTALDWSSELLVSAALDGQVIVWDNSLALRETLDVIPCCLRDLTSNSRYFLFRQEDVVWEWDNQTEQLRPVLLDEIKITDMVISPTGNYLAVSTYKNSSKVYPVLYQRNPQGNFVPIAVNEQSAATDDFHVIKDMHFTPDESRLIVAKSKSGESYILEFSIPGLELLEETRISAGPSGKLALAPDGAIAMIDTSDLLFIKRETVIDTHYHSLDGALDMRYSPNGQLIGIGSNGYAVVIPTNDLESEKTYCRKGYTASDSETAPLPTYFAFTQNSQMLVCAHIALEFWDLTTGTDVSPIYPLGDEGAARSITNGLALSADDSQIFVLYGREFQLWQP